VIASGAVSKGLYGGKSWYSTLLSIVLTSRGTFFEGWVVGSHRRKI
jgi:hypothetical protein